MSVGNSERLLATAAEIGAVFAAEAAEGERLRELSRAALDAVVDSGFFSTLVPKRFGGLEIDFDVIPNMVREMAKGDLASAWVAQVLHGTATGSSDPIRGRSWPMAPSERNPLDWYNVASTGQEVLDDDVGRRRNPEERGLARRVVEVERE